MQLRKKLVMAEKAIDQKKEEEQELGKNFLGA